MTAKNEAHAGPPAAQREPLYDPGVATPTHAERARTLVEALSAGTLAREPAGHPYGSLVTFGLDAGRPVFAISELAEHTKNLRADARASLLVAESHARDPLANGRVTLLGRCAPLAGSARASAERAYLARFPDAAGFVGFRDFGLWALEVSSARYIGGYGRMSWLSGGDWSRAEPDPIAPLAAGILQHMNQDHADALPLYCRAFSRASQASEVEMTAIDRYGFELSVRTAEGPRPVRLAFPEPIASAADARRALVALLEQACQKLRG